MPRSENRIVTWWIDSGVSDRKSQNMSGSFRFVRRVALLRVDEVGELERVADEEDRRVVAGHVVVAFLGVELDREAARVALGVGRALLAAHGGEPGEDLGLLADLGEERGLRVLA